MADYSKSATNLAAGLYQEFFGSNTAVVPRVKELVTAQPEEVADYLAEQWEVSSASLRGSLSNLASGSASSIAHSDQWKYLLRVAQCAALANYRIEARLVPLVSIAEDPHVLATETIHGIGQRALSLVHQAIDPKLLQHTTETAAHWGQGAVELVSALGIKPHGFVKAMNRFEELAAPDQLPRLLEEGPHNSMQALYRIETAAAVVGHSVQVEFVPFSQQAGGEAYNG